MAFIRVSVLTWKVGAGSPEAREVTRKVQEEMVPLARSLPGFVSYQAFAAQERERTTLAVTVFASKEQAESAAQRLAEWTQQNAGQLLESREVYSGETLAGS